eukprot:14008354-Ditylum_brightwellii.AAC.1
MGITRKDDKTTDTLVDIVEPTPLRYSGRRKKARESLTLQPAVDPRHAKRTISVSLSARLTMGVGPKKPMPTAVVDAHANDVQ